MDDEGSPLPGDETIIPHAIGLGWAADQSAAAPKTAETSDEEVAAELPAIDADGKGFGWIAFIDGDMNVQIRRFSLANPTAAPTEFDDSADRALDPGRTTRTSTKRSRAATRAST